MNMLGCDVNLIHSNSTNESFNNKGSGKQSFDSADILSNSRNRRLSHEEEDSTSVQSRRSRKHRSDPESSRNNKIVDNHFFNDREIKGVAIDNPSPPPLKTMSIENFPPPPSTTNGWARHGPVQLMHNVGPGNGQVPLMHNVGPGYGPVSSMHNVGPGHGPVPLMHNVWPGRGPLPLAPIYGPAYGPAQLRPNGWPGQCPAPLPLNVPYRPFNNLSSLYFRPPLQHPLPPIPPPRFDSWDSSSSDSSFSDSDDEAEGYFHVHLIPQAWGQCATIVRGFKPVHNLTAILNDLQFELRCQGYIYWDQYLGKVIKLYGNRITGVSNFLVLWKIRLVNLTANTLLLLQRLFSRLPLTALEMVPVRPKGYVSIVQSLKLGYKYSRILSDLRSEFSCDGFVVKDQYLGWVIKLLGDHVWNVSIFLHRVNNLLIVATNYASAHYNLFLNSSMLCCCKQ
ncbi:hypothetical protein VNO77_43493 [Canavalia gladiata]|uniref:SUI1 domain-containing protein n=1 Tax=Canavalia gladiata TaxID=3824 RepID=A0AAN9JX74_CANGL